MANITIGLDHREISKLARASAANAVSLAVNGDDAKTLSGACASSFAAGLQFVKDLHNFLLAISVSIFS
ncbi:MAG: hypothetical protein MUC92_09915 [Fimbriimonadaceae bacterium]|nr:hypothetical protein [Fimbriimonadaceae bacterium]